MIIVKLKGGLGNQLFGYAFYRSLQLKNANINVYLDKSTYINDCNKRGNLYPIQIDLYNVVVNECTIEQKDLLANDGRTFLRKVIRKLFGNKKSYILEQNPLKYDSQVMDKDNVYLDGYWQTSKYFDDIRDTILTEISLKIPLDSANQDLLNKIESTNAVGVHVRRGDYLKVPEMYGGICTSAYYIHAIDYMRRHTDNPVFYIFSNDINWCREVFASYTDIEYVDINGEDRGYFDLELMRNCKHNIIANSSFSWWGAWLNENPEKIVIAPKKWLNGEVNDDVCPEDWKRM